MMWSLTVLTALCCLLQLCNASLPDGLYCGVQSCYDVLEVTRDSEKSEIAKAYRRKARLYHPDKYKEADAEEKFQLIATAYETLKDEELRADYDYFLDNPDEYLYHYYMYYRRRVAPKVDVRLVILGTILVISLVQYISWWTSYNSALKYALSQPKYRMQAKDIAQKDGLLRDPQLLRKKLKMTKEEIKLEEEKTLMKVIEDNLTVTGGFRKPSVIDVLLVQIVCSPYYLVVYVKWWAGWHWRFTMHKEEFGPEEKIYLTRKKLKLSAEQWQTQAEEMQSDLLEKELWIKENHQAYLEEKKFEERTKLAESNRYKQYRRYMKNNKSRITFMED